MFPPPGRTGFGAADEHLTRADLTRINERVLEGSLLDAGQADGCLPYVAPIARVWKRVQITAQHPTLRSIYSYVEVTDRGDGVTFVVLPNGMVGNYNLGEINGSITADIGDIVWAWQTEGDTSQAGVEGGTAGNASAWQFVAAAAVPTACTLAALRPTDCLVAQVTGTGNFVLLTYDDVTDRWTSDPNLLVYPYGSGVAEFWFAGGALHFSIDGLELVHCNNLCWMGGDLTGLGPGASGTGTGSDSRACHGPSFQVCLHCVSCPGTGTGTGTGTHGTGSAGTGTNVLRTTGTGLLRSCQLIDFGSATLTISNREGECFTEFPTSTTQLDGSIDAADWGFPNHSGDLTIRIRLACNESNTTNLYALWFGTSSSPSGGCAGVLTSFSASPVVLVFDFPWNGGGGIFPTGCPPCGDITAIPGSVRMTVTVP